MHDERSVSLWHGGAPGRRVGDALLPPVATGFEKTSRKINGPPPKGKYAGYRPNLVYATSDREFAEVWALLYTQDSDRPGIGVVYEVELECVAPDEDLSSFGDSFQAKRGIVLSDGVPVQSAPARLREILEARKKLAAQVSELRIAEAEKQRQLERQERQIRHAAKRERRRQR